jgi:hypothetical protein
MIFFFLYRELDLGEGKAELMLSRFTAACFYTRSDPKPHLPCPTQRVYTRDQTRLHVSKRSLEDIKEKLHEQ